MNNDFEKVSDSFESEKHPVEITEEKTMLKEDRHILSVSETDDSVVVEFEKHNEDVDVNVDLEDDRDLDLQDVSYRTIHLDRAYVDEKERRVRIGVSSEEPVEREFGMEVLSHKKEDINSDFMSSGRAPLLLDHDMKQQIGVIEQYKLDEAAKRTVAVVRFGKSTLAQEVFQDVVDGIKQNISVGYRVNRLDEDENKKGYYRAAWTPMEASIVSIPADQSNFVGVGRSEQNEKVKIEMSEEKSQEINLDEVRAQSAEQAKAEFKRNSKEILDLAVKHDKRDLADQAISEGLSVEEFRGVLLENISNDKPLDVPEIGMTPKEVKRFSLVKAINALANPNRSEETRLNSSHITISYAVFCLKKKKKIKTKI